MIYLAFYKARGNLTDKIIRLFTRGIYSHCDMAILRDNGEYDCYTSSPRDGGVRMKTMPLPADDWDLVPLHDLTLLHEIHQFFAQTQGAKYDLFGAIGVVLLNPQNRHKWFCSEWCAHVLGLPKPWRYSPNDLYKIVKRLE